MTWAIGDIQGCYTQLRALLDAIEFNPKRDKLWLVGDLVNRGEESLETLEYLYSIRKSVVIVLGNHDLALIATYAGIKKSNSTLDPILKSPNAKKLIDWLRGQKFLHVDSKLGYCMSHAGISPLFNLRLAKNYARRCEEMLQSKGYKLWLALMQGKNIAKFEKKMSEVDRERFLYSSFVRMRYCFDDGTLDYAQKGSPNLTPVESEMLKPWFLNPNRKKIKPKIIFGHWAALGYFNNEDVCCLDSGCVWGNGMSAMRLDDHEERVVRVKCQRDKGFSEEF